MKAKTTAQRTLPYAIVSIAHLRLGASTRGAFLTEFLIWVCVTVKKAVENVPMM
jgi:hypothetical protein